MDKRTGVYQIQSYAKGIQKRYYRCFYPFCQRCYAVFTRSANAATQLVLHTQAERKEVLVKLNRRLEEA